MQAYLVGLPKHLYLLFQILDDVGAFFACQPHVVELFAGQKKTAQCQHDGAAYGLGRMGREDGQIERLVQQDLQLVRFHALIMEFLQGMAEGAKP